MDTSMADALAEIRTTIATLSTKLDLLIQRIDPMLMDHEQRIRELEKRTPDGLADRLTALEQWRWRLAGAALGGGGIGGAIAAVLTTIIGG